MDIKFPDLPKMDIVCDSKIEHNFARIYTRFLCKKGFEKIKNLHAILFLIGLLYLDLVWFANLPGFSKFAPFVMPVQISNRILQR